jgi:hypothetical protein
MKTKLCCLLMFFSVTAFAQNQTTHDHDWEGATMRVQSEHHSSIQNGVNAGDQLELSHPWHYGRQDSDTLVNRERQDTHQD